MVKFIIMIPEPQLIFNLIPAKLIKQFTINTLSRAKNMECFAIINYIFP